MESEQRDETHVEQHGDGDVNVGGGGEGGVAPSEPAQDENTGQDEGGEPAPAGDESEPE